jgi:hypothetical protein
MRALQEIMSHRDFKTTLIYADYAPRAREAGRGGGVCSFSCARQAGFATDVSWGCW